MFRKFNHFSSTYAKYFYQTLSLILAFSPHASPCQLLHYPRLFPVLCVVFSAHFFPPSLPFISFLPPDCHINKYFHTRCSGSIHQVTKHITVSRRLMVFILLFPFTRIIQFCDFPGIECEWKLATFNEMKPPQFGKTLSQSCIL